MGFGFSSVCLLSDVDCPMTAGLPQPWAETNRGVKIAPPCGGTGKRGGPAWEKVVKKIIKSYLLC